MLNCVNNLHTSKNKFDNMEKGPNSDSTSILDHGSGNESK